MTILGCICLGWILVLKTPSMCLCQIWWRHKIVRWSNFSIKNEHTWPLVRNPTRNTHNFNFSTEANWFKCEVFHVIWLRVNGLSSKGHQRSITLKNRTSDLVWPHSHVIFVKYAQCIIFFYILRIFGDAHESVETCENILPLIVWKVNKYKYKTCLSKMKMFIPYLDGTLLLFFFSQIPIVMNHFACVVTFILIAKFDVFLFL